MHESLAESYYKTITEIDNPIPVLVKFFCIVFSVERPPSKLYSVIGKLCNLYGAKMVFFSILDCADIDNFNIDNPYPIISYFSKKRLEKSFTSNIDIDLSKTAEKYKAKILELTSE